MPKISKQKKEKISEQVLHYLFEKSPEPQFTSKIAENIARDEEFIKAILNELEKKQFIIKITKNPFGRDYQRRERWRLSNDVFEAYKKSQNNNLYNHFEVE